MKKSLKMELINSIIKGLKLTCKYLKLHDSLLYTIKSLKIVQFTMNFIDMLIFKFSDPKAGIYSF